VRLQSGESDSVVLWKRICDISRRGFQEIYDLLDVKLIERGESFYQPYLKGVVEELDGLGLITVSEGAKCLFLEEFKNREGNPMPLMVQKSDGGYNYDTTDLAAIWHRIFIEKADRIIIVTDIGQSLHFQLLFAAARRAGWLARISHMSRKSGEQESATHCTDSSREREKYGRDLPEVEVDHVGFGLVLGADGKKFKTRSGETEKLIDLLTEAIDRSKEVLKERLPDMPMPEIDHLARVLGIGAVKYADLSSNRTKDYTFSYERMLRFEGDTALFLLYAYVRIQGIKRRARAAEKPLGIPAPQHPSEIALSLHLCRFGEILENMAHDLLPHRLAEYLYHLAEKFNAFFRDCRVEGSPEEASRLALAELTARILRQGLFLLGIETVNRM
jgi:arginyl-tRNA synthetase